MGLLYSHSPPVNALLAVHSYWMRWLCLNISSVDLLLKVTAKLNSYAVFESWVLLTSPTFYNSIIF